MSLLLLVNPKAGVTGTQTIEPELITNTPVLYGPQVDQVVVVGLISNAPTLFAPSVAQSVVVGVIANGYTVFAPTLGFEGVQTVTVELIKPGPHVYAPALTKFWIRDVGTHSGRGPKLRKDTRIHSGRGLDR